VPAASSAGRVLRLGTRGSPLALVQSRAVGAALADAGVAVEIEIIRTAGDDQAPDTSWGEGAFVGALERALLDGSVDLAVHSSKDVPTTEDPRLVIAAFCRREDPRDALVCRERGGTLATLPHGARVGTDSPRRTAFLLERRPDLRLHPLNGNVDTRLRRLDAGESDALVLAVAGLTRLGRADRIDERLDLDVVVPAPGQGAVAVQVRSDDAVARELVSRLDDAPTRAAVEAERAFLHASGGGCRAPIGAHARVEGDEIVIRAAVAREPVDPATITVARDEARGPITARHAVAEGLAARLRPMRGTGAPGAARRPCVLVTRARSQAVALVGALDARDIDAVAVPTIDLADAPHGPLDAVARDLRRFAWVVVTSANGVAALVEACARVGMDPATARWAAVGRATAAELRRRGVTPAFVPTRSSGAGIGDELPFHIGDRVLLARSDIADDGLPEALRAAGANVACVVAYRTVEAPEASRGPLADVLRSGAIDALVFTSGSTVRGLLALAPDDVRPAVLAIPACCIGTSTADAARAAGFAHVVTAGTQTADGLAEAVAHLLVIPAVAMSAVPDQGASR
jgi:hydroxymethylbilane synthase